MTLTSVAPQPGGAFRRRFASPLARRLACDEVLDLDGVEGTGPHGRVVEIDVLRAISRRKKLDARQPLNAKPVQGSHGSIVSLFEVRPCDLVAHNDAGQAAIARLTAATQIPCFSVSAECAVEALLRLLNEINGPGDAAAGQKLAMASCLVKAMALTLRDLPAVNVAWTPEATMFSKSVDIAVPVAGGVRVLRDADRRTLSALTAELKLMTVAEEGVGATTLVSDMGAFGIASCTPLLTAPCSSSVAFGSVTERMGKMMTASFVFDRRVIDERLGAELAGRVRHYLETPMALLA